MTTSLPYVHASLIFKLLSMSRSSIHKHQILTQLLREIVYLGLKYDGSSAVASPAISNLGVSECIHPTPCW